MFLTIHIELLKQLLSGHSVPQRSSSKSLQLTLKQLSEKKNKSLKPVLGPTIPDLANRKTAIPISPGVHPVLRPVPCGPKQRMCTKGAGTRAAHADLSSSIQPHVA